MSILSAREAEQLAGRVIIAGFEGTSAPDELLDAARDGALGGVVLFKRNAESPEQVADLLGELAGAAADARPLVCAVDQEGGRVVRLHEPLTVLPPARRLGEIDDPALTAAAGLQVGRELGALGFTVDFAPVLDVDTNPASPVIGDRSFGGEPEQVVRHGLAFARGLRDGGVMPCGKHFPGHGDAALDSHVALPVVEHERPRLERVELEPFAAWAATGLGPLMTAHVIFPALDPERPATASRPILEQLLRGELRFRGAVFSDDLEMGAVGEIGGPAEVGVTAIRAGVNGLLVCHQAAVLEAVRSALARTAIEEPSFAARLERSAGSLAPLALPAGPKIDRDWIGSDDQLRSRDELLARLDG